MQAPLPLTRELVLIGGGHAHALVLRLWGMQPLAGARLTLINPGPTAPYTGMLPGYVAGHYQRDDLEIDLVRLARFAGARLILDSAVAMDPQARRITLAGGRTLPYHIASLDIGITSDLPLLPGFAEHGVPAKPLAPYADAWAGFRSAVAAGQRRAQIAVIGGGVGGVELALAMAHALQRDRVEGIEITLIESDRILQGTGKRARQALLKRLTAVGVSLREQTRVSEVFAEHLRLSDGTSIRSQFTVTTTGARPQGWLAGTGLALQDGFVRVDRTLRAIQAAEIFAVGDCAHLDAAPRPKAGVFAVRQAPVLYHNLRAALSGGPLKEFRPQRDYLKLISLGEQAAVADKWRLRLQGRALWRLKDRIDQKFMRQFKELAPMALSALPQPHAQDLVEALGTEPLCGGCGAKVGGAALAPVLAGIPALQRGDVLSRPGDDAAILRGPGRSRQVISTDHLRAFTEDPWMLARIAAVHALGDVWAMGARPQAALASIILPRLSGEMQQHWLAEIMAAAGEVFAAEGAEIVGGHTSLGAELTIGFTVTGLCEQNPITLAGARPGDALILTKPLGSGTILAAEMALRARGDWLAAALASMTQPQGGAAAVLAGAHAMTDVTGFGLAGHLLGMAKASGVGIELALADLGFLEGAEALAASGVRASLYSDNRALLPDLDPGDDPRATLLFDPQTAGGLVAAVAPEMVGEHLSKLRSLRYDAKAIGRCLAGPPGLSLKR